MNKKEADRLLSGRGPRLPRRLKRRRQEFTERMAYALERCEVVTDGRFEIVNAAYETERKAEPHDDQ